MKNSSWQITLKCDLCLNLTNYRATHFGKVRKDETLDIAALLHSVLLINVPVLWLMPLGMVFDHCGLCQPGKGESKNAHFR
jgi:hypothetical protein